MAKIEKTIVEIQRLFDSFNSRFYDNKLIQPIITVQTNGKKHRAMGWCSTRKIWKDNIKNEEYFEITICAEYLNRSIEDICSTLLHEMVHLYHFQNGIKDVSRSGMYHNKKFKETAEKKGLIVEYDNSIGWSISTLNNNTKNFLNSLDIDKKAFALTRYRNINGEKPTRKHSTRKYICPICGMSVRATKEVNIMCGDCDMTMETLDQEFFGEMLRK